MSPPPASPLAPVGESLRRDDATLVVVWMSGRFVATIHSPVVDEGRCHYIGQAEGDELSEAVKDAAMLYDCRRSAGAFVSHFG